MLDPEILARCQRRAVLYDGFPTTLGTDIALLLNEVARLREDLFIKTAEWETMMSEYKRLRAEVERLTQVAARLASEAACERLRAEKAEAEVERLRKAISNVMTDDQLSTIVPAIGMTTREALRGEGEK